jgi:hypothetical protein
MGLVWETRESYLCMRARLYIVDPTGKSPSRFLRLGNHCVGREKDGLREVVIAGPCAYMEPQGVLMCLMVRMSNRTEAMFSRYRVPQIDSSVHSYEIVAVERLNWDENVSSRVPE